MTFPRDYILLRKDDTKPVKLKKEVRYELVKPKIPVGVIIGKDMLGKV
jgi:hypothetical protein